MVCDIKAMLVKYKASNQASQLQALQDTLNSKDFEVCTLSPFQQFSSTQFDAAQSLYLSVSLHTLFKYYCIRY